jgi:hypothetical protein
LRLATAELQRKGKRFCIGAGLAGAAGVLALLGARHWLPPRYWRWQRSWPHGPPTLVVGVALLVVAGLAALIGRGQLKRAVPPVPEEAAASIQQDIKVVKERARS